MAFMKYARAHTVTPDVGRKGWQKVRVASHVEPSGKLLDAASDILGEQFDPKNYLLSHCTLVASVDTYAPEGVRLGHVQDGSSRIYRKFAEYRVTPETDALINNNHDAFDRQVLLKSYRTLIGAENYFEHVQVPDLSKGKIIDAVARDLGHSIYVDVLVATHRKHKQLVADILSGKMAAMSMGCFLPGTQVTLADGRRIAIEDVQPGEMVLTHTGEAKAVVNKQIRHRNWSMRRVSVSGLPTDIHATDNHPFFVLRPREVCACGCGEALPTLRRKDMTARLRRNFRIGHRLRVFNPNNSYSEKERQERLSALERIESQPELVEVEAGDLREGDLLSFPRASYRGNAVSEGKARLLGYFLAEGCFLKHKGKHCEVQFHFSLEERETFASEVAELLEQEFGVNPWLQDREDRNTCTVHATGQEMVQWFLSHGGEYSHGKKLSQEVIGWEEEAHRHLIATWINGDGCQHSKGSLVTTTVSYDLACQMHMLMARCGWYARMECRVGKKKADLRKIVNGGFSARDDFNRRPSFNLVIGKSMAVGMAPYCAKAPTGSSYKSARTRVVGGHVVFPVTSVSSYEYEGWVHDMEVEDNHSYVVEGVAVHNCSVEGCICTKCGNWAADETEACSHIKYEKGNSFFDSNGQQHRVAEICGHPSLDPTGGVNFIEGSWVQSPAFLGAAFRNVLSPTEDMVRQAQAVLSQPPKEWTADARRKAAFSMHVGIGTATEGRTVATLPSSSAHVGPVDLSRATRMFLAGWDDEEDTSEEDTSEEEGAAPAEDTDNLQKMEDDLAQHVRDRVKNKLKEDMRQRDLGEPTDSTPMDPNDSVQREASLKSAAVHTLLRIARSDIEFVDGLARLDKAGGNKINVALYRAALAAGPCGEGPRQYLSKCASFLGNKHMSEVESKQLLRIGQLLAQRETFPRG